MTGQETRNKLTDYWNTLIQIPIDIGYFEKVSLLNIGIKIQIECRDRMTSSGD